jgi:capsid portal protein
MNPLSTAKNLVSFAKSQLPMFQTQMKQNKHESMAFTFGDAVPVLNGNELSDYLESWFNGRWYEPQVNMNGLAKSYKSTPY